jgi:hypothetical protein
MKTMKKVKCERCGRIRDLFQYTFFDEPKIINKVIFDPKNDPQYTTQTIQIDESRGLCEECAIEINKKKYDLLIKENK